MDSTKSVYAIPEGVSLDLGDCKVEQVLPHDRKLRKVLIETLTASFAGTEKTAPEGSADWGICGEERAGKHFEPLSKPPSEFRTRMNRWVVNLALLKYGKHGACFLLTHKETGAPLAASICVPPGKNIHKESLGFTIKSSLAALFWYKGPSVCWEGWGRVLASKKVLEECHETVPNPLHWYVCMLATHPDAQGQGYGKKFLLVLAALADEAKVESYLEASGERNVSFYSGVGNYEDRKAFKIVTKKSVFDDYGGTHGMVRPYSGV